MSFSEKMLQSLADGDIDGADLLLQQALIHDDLAILIELGEILIERGFLIEAKEVFLHLQENSQEEADLVQIYLAEIAIEEEDFETAFSLLDEIKETSEYYPKALFEMANAYQMIGFLEVSLSKLQTLLALLPDDPTVQFAYAEIALLAERDALAQNMYELLLAAGFKEYSNVSILARLALTLANQGKFEEALTYYQEAYQQKKSVDVLLHLARLQVQLKENQSAIQYYEELLELDPSQSDPYIELADIYIQEQQPIQARDLLLRAIKENPYFVYFYLHLAEVYQQLEDFDNAQKYLEQALNLGEEEDNVLTALTKNSFYLEDYQQALDYFAGIENAYQGDLLWIVAQCYNQLEDFEQASRYYELAKEELQTNSAFLKDYVWFLRDEGRINEALLLLQNYLSQQPMHDESLHELYDELSENQW